MNISTRSSLHEGVNPPSLVRRVVAWDWRDGPIEGLLQIGESGEVFYFRMLEEKPASGDEDEIRVFGLYPVPSETLDHLTRTLGAYQQPRQPIWWVVWQFPSESITAQIDELVDSIKDNTGPLIWIIATTSSFDNIRAMSVSETVSA